MRFSGLVRSAKEKHHKNIQKPRDKRTDLSAKPAGGSFLLYMVKLVPNPAQVEGLRRNMRIPRLSNCGVRHFIDICTKHAWCTIYQ